MPDVKRLVQITLLVLAIVSSSLLGLGLESPRLILIAVAGAAIGFMVADVLKLFRIEGALANIASIIILFLAMKDFFVVDSTGKLVSVANLLVYLQTVLMFQEKTPRINWQILVLSLLQVVVGTIFSLDFKAGLLFLFYFFNAGVVMVLQSIYSDTTDIERRNRQSANRWKSSEGSEDESVLQPFAPLMFFDSGTAVASRAGSMICHFAIWIIISAIFASVMFYLVPRHRTPWFGPSSISVASTGISKSVDLDERGIVKQSNQPMFRVSFRKSKSEGAFEPTGEPPYFRGLALSSLAIKNGKTNWVAPHDRVNRNFYQPVGRYPEKGELVYQSIVLQESVDPLVYGIFPSFRTADSPKNLWFCHEVSALTRCRAGEQIDLSPKPYEFATIVDGKGRFSKFWPYISNTDAFTQKPMENDLPQRRWLTEMDPSRYRALVGISDQISSEHRPSGVGDDRIGLLKKLEEFFLVPGRFKYTLDFRKIKWDERLDPVEDFVRNHRSGHCELYASALTLMLRHQDIPARLVVGFHGAEFNSITGSHLVRQKNAHAWVEAYLRPEDCTEQMLDNGQAGPGGAWMILDPTPFSTGNTVGGVGDAAIDLARTVWDGYVLGIDVEENVNYRAYANSPFRFLSRWDLTEVQDDLESTNQFLKGSLFRYTAIGTLALLCFLMWWRSAVVIRGPGNHGKKAGRFRRIVAKAISLISPGLGAWVMDRGSRSSPCTDFYERMLKVLSTCGLQRKPNQTHREFAIEVASHFGNFPSANLIQSTVHEITELFNEVRFGNLEMDAELLNQIRLSLGELETAIRVEITAEPRSI